MKILYVDDSPTLLKAAVDKLEKEGWEVETAVNGAEAIEMARSFEPNIIFMDIEMPIMRGDEAVKKLKLDEKTKSIPIIALTSRSRDAMGETADLFDDYLVKPFGFADIVPKVKSLLRDVF